MLLMASGNAGVSAQPYALFDVPDSVLAEVIAGARAQYEGAWNALLVAELRATAAKADSAAALRALARRVAAMEPEALGSRIGLDALRLRDRWNSRQRALRIDAAVRESLAAASQSSRRHQEADSLYDRALADYRSLGEKRRQAWVLGSLGLAAFQRGDLARADSIYRLALDARRAIGDARMVGNSLNSLGSTHYLLGNYVEARGFFEEARAVREGTGERAALGSTLNYLGLTLVELGAADSASASFERALELTVAGGDSARTAEVLLNYLFLLAERGELGRAIALGDRAETIYQELGNRRAEGALHTNLGNLLRQQGRFHDADTHLAEAIRIAEEFGDSRGLLQALLSQGQVGLVLRDPERGRPPLERALRLADSLSDARAQAAALNNLAELVGYEGDRSGAERLATDALERATAAEDRLLEHDVAVTLGGLAYDQRDAEHARQWYTRAEVAGRGASEEARASDFNNLGIAAILADSLEVAERHFRQALDLAERAGSPDGAWPPLLGLGEVAERRGQFPLALAYDRRAATMIDTLRARQGEEGRAITLLSGRIFAFEALIHLLARLQPSYPDSAFVSEAFHWSERARARALSDLLDDAPSGSAPAPATMEEARAALPSRRSVLLYYSLGDSSSSLWAISHTEARHYRVPTRRQLRSRIETLRRGLETPAGAMDAATVRASRFLYDALVAPAAAVLRQADRVVVAPDGPLALVPFEAFLIQDAKPGVPPEAESYLASRYTVSYVPSASVLAALKGRSRGSGIVALGNPEFGVAAADSQASEGRPTLEPLPHTKAELDAIEREKGELTVARLEGSKATREALLGTAGLSAAQLVHLATHGEAHELEPERSGLWLAPGAPQGPPDFLAVTDVLPLRLSADLVVLSACESGLGRLERGEGILGLPRSFLAAGARSVIVSLWKVSDRSTATLMTEFYRQLLGRGTPTDESLAAAKRSLLRRKETQSPFFWAPFVMIGRDVETERVSKR